jgi:hypothetical protein
LKEKKIVDP